MFEMQRRLLYIPVFHLDANLINARQKLEPVNQLEQWRCDGVILLNMSSTAHAEAQAGKSQSRERKAGQQIFTMTPPDSGDVYRRVESVLFPDGAKNENEQNDVKVVCDAVQYEAILVTNDGGSKSQPGGILGNRDKLRDLVQIMSPEEAVKFVRSKITERDEFNRRISEEIGSEIPEWTGLD